MKKIQKLLLLKPPKNFSRNCGQLPQKYVQVLRRLLLPAVQAGHAEPRISDAEDGVASEPVEGQSSPGAAQNRVHHP